MAYIFLFLSLITLPGWTAIKSVSNSDIVMTVGKTTRVKASDLNRIWIESGKIIKVADPASLTFQALKLGSSRVLIGSQEFHFYVVTPDQLKTYEALQQVIKDTFDLHLEVQDRGIVVTGLLPHIQDYSRLTHAMQNIQGNFILSCKVDPVVQKEILEILRRQLSKSGLAMSNFRFAPFLSTDIYEKSELLDRYRKALEPMGVLVEKSVESVDMAPLVRLKITVTEMKKDLLRTWGVKWPTSMSANLISGKAVESIDLDLQALEEQGHGKVLAHPEILTRSGKEAEFWAGGEFPIRIKTANVLAVQWKKYGITLKVKPTVDSLGRMSIAMETEVSSLDPSRAVEGIPAMLNHRVQTHFDLLNSQTIVLSGLIKNEEANSSDGLPGLSSIPILGSLFSSKNFRENRTELVILVHPEVLP